MGRWRQVQKRAPVGANSEGGMYLLFELEREKDELRASLGTKKLEVATDHLAWPLAPASVPSYPVAACLGAQAWRRPAPLAVHLEQPLLLPVS